MFVDIIKPIHSLVQNYNMRRLFISIYFITGMLFCSYGQNAPVSRTLTGKVVDVYGQPIEGVEIKAKGSSVAVYSNASGGFELAGVSSSVLTFSRKGYDVITVKGGNKKSLTIQLVESYLKNPENADVLYDVKSKDKILGSVSTVYTSQLVTSPAPLYAYALAGRMPGLYTQQTSGWTNTGLNPITYTDAIFGQFPTASLIGSKGPSDNSEILMKLRGQTPVTMVDGIEREIYTLSPENIESVSVLKDALSTILLGMNSSRGVVLVTTKKPIKGSPHVSFTTQTGVQTPLGLQDPLSSSNYAYLYNEALANDQKKAAYTYDDFKAYQTGSDPYGHPDVNWYKTALKDNSLMKRYDLNVSGGGNAARYSVGLGYFQQDGLLKSDATDYNSSAQLKRYTINTNIDVNVTPQFTTQLQLYGRIQDGNQPGATLSSIMGAIYNTPNNAYPVFNANGSLGGGQNYQTNIYGMINRSGYITDYTRDISANVILKYKFDKLLKGLYTKVQTNLSSYTAYAADRSKTSSVFKMTTTPDGDIAYNQYGSNTDIKNSFLLSSSAQYWYLQGTIGYDKTDGDHHLSTKLFYDRREAIFNFDLPEFKQNNAFTASYDYKNKYFIEGALNYSGNNRYPKDKQFGLFYAGGIGYDIAQENFIKNNSGLGWINKFKLRTTYGLNGNANVGYFSWRESYNTDFTIPAYPMGINRTITSFSLSQNTFANPFVSWEKANKFNVGLDIEMFKNHLQLSAEYYSNRYFDLLGMRGRQTALAGIIYPMENIGINQYTGTEFSATYQNQHRGFNYFLTGNLSIEQSKVIYMDEIQAYNWNARTGRPVGMTFGYMADGFIQTAEEARTSPSIAGVVLQPGDLKLQDMNEDGVINIYDQQPIGSEKPVIYYGLTTGISFKKFDITLLVQGVQNKMYLLPGDYSFGFSGRGQGYSHISNRWIPENSLTATYPRLTAGVNANNDYNAFYGANANSFWMHKGDYFRIKNIDIGYTINAGWLRRMKVASCRVFFNGMNLFTKAAFNRVDPEVYTQVYPIQKVMNFGLNIKF